jgi:hypothetical protein
MEEAAHVRWLKPPMYDGFRHFLFIVPPLFILSGIGADALFRWLKPIWVRVLLALILLLPALVVDVYFHPYQYTYYNFFVGSTHGAAYRYETDYWLTCYKDSMEWINQQSSSDIRVFVNREGDIAQYYAREGVQVIDLGRSKNIQPQPGDYLLLSSRADPGIHRAIIEGAHIEARLGAVFCVAKVNQ